MYEQVLPNGNVLFNISRIHYNRCNDCSGYGSSLILIKGCKSLVEHVVAHFVGGFVELFVMYLVSILVVSSCKEPCNILCRLCLLL